MNQKKEFYLNYVLSVFLLVVVNFIFIKTSEYDLFGWYLIPINLCGSIMLYELVKYLRGQYDLFEPRGLIAFFGTHYFYISPLLFLGFSRHMYYLENPSDWGKWIGILSIMNLIGLLIYKIVLHYGLKNNKKKINTTWTINYRIFIPLLIIFLTIALVAQTYFFISQGGLTGLIQSKTDRTLDLDGKGWLLMIGESLPILMFYAVYILLKNKKISKSNLIIFILITLFLIVQFTVAGLRGSRSTTIFALFWIVVIIHYTIKKFNRKQFLIGLIFIVFFMVGYGYYKNIGNEITNVFKGENTLQTIQDENENRGLLNTLTADLSRTSTQAFLIYRLYEHGEDYKFALGETYVKAITLPIPSRLIEMPFTSKVEAGTELMYGKGTYVKGQMQSSRVYGILGEGLLNYHVFSIPIVFLFWSYFVLMVTRIVNKLPKNDARWLILPLLIQLTFTSVNSDLDNMIFGLIKFGLLPFLLIYLSTKKINTLCK